MASKKVYNVIFTEDAADDLDGIYLYPFSANLVLDEVLQEKGYRKLVIDNYLVFYLVDECEKSVILVRILYGAKNYEQLL